MIGQTVNRTKVARKKTLNVIYFIDSEKTKSLQLNVATVVGLFSALSLVLLWFFASIYLGYVAIRDRSNLLNFVREARHTLFEYEARFENVYENVYPSEAKKETTQSAPGSDNSEPAPAVIAEAKAPILAQGDAKPKIVAVTAPRVAAPVAVPVAVAAPKENAKSEIAGTTVAGSNPNSVSAEAVAPSDSFLVKVDNAVFKNATEKLEMRVDINNEDGKNKAEGYVWALATFKSDSGEEIFVAAPSGMHVNAGGDAGDIKNAQRYAIQYHKPKSFVFSSPKPGGGKFTQVKVVLQNYTGKSSEFKFPLSDDVSR